TIIDEIAFDLPRRDDPIARRQNPKVNDYVARLMDRLGIGHEAFAQQMAGDAAGTAPRNPPSCVRGPPQASCCSSSFWLHGSGDRGSLVSRLTLCRHFRWSPQNLCMIGEQATCCCTPA